MSEILSIKELREIAKPIVYIPNFDNTGTIAVRLQKPNMINLAAQGKIPNHLLSTAAKMVGLGETKKEKQSIEDQIKEVAQMMELYCRACLVEPTYEEMKDILTEEQMEFIFDWAQGDIRSLEPFRKDEGDGPDNNNSKGI